MAGESPDRSKQRESSAEPTSGSAVPVPEARDPRLAMSRDGDSSGGTTDTATQILSLRPPKPSAPAEDPDLREAVSAWVRTATPNLPEDDTAPKDEQAGGTPEAGSEDAAAADDEGGAEARPEDADGADGEGAAGAAAEADSEPEAKATGSPDASAEDTAAGEAEGAADAETDGDTDVATDGADPRAEKTTEAKATGGTGAAEGSAEARAEKTADAETDRDTDVATDGADPRAEKTTEAKAEGTADARTEGAAGTEAVGEDDAEARTEGDTEAEAKAAEAEATNADADANGKATPTADTAADAKADTDQGTSGGAKGNADAGDATAADADAEAVAGEGVAADRDGDGVAEAGLSGDEPEAAGEGAPQGPPAADRGTRTGGAGGDEDGEDAEDGEDEAEAKPAHDTDTPPADGNEDAEGEAKAKGVDQPTAVFKAVRPRKPDVDQPTTMLKLGGAPKAPQAPAADSERTSKFVALKPDVTTSLPQVGPERTTQQPLPPKPPLDLLAELTNTPPPPETPLRTIVRRVKIWTPLVLLLAVVFAVVQTLRPLPQPTLDLTAKDTYTFDGGKLDIPWPSHGQAALDVQGVGTFGNSGDQKPVPIASVAKVMTAYLILHDHPLKSGADGPKIKIDQAAEDQSNAGHESTVHVTKGDSISQREALEGILIASANNVARLLARWDAGSEQAFVAKMNATAKKLGMTSTTYTDPSGLTDSTVSTAVDQVKLAKTAMTLPAFREVAAMMSYTDYKGGYHSNWNQLVGHNNVVGIKTGTTTSALGNLVFAAKQQAGGETRTIVGAVLRQPAGGPEPTILDAALDSSDKLIRAAQGALKSATILKKGDVVGYVDDGLGGRTPVVVTKDVTAAGWAGLKVKLSFTADDVPHTAKAGTKVGSLTVGDGSAGAVKVPVALEKDLTEPGFADKLTRLR
ncbi:D-alanyl-D-alanine carboxypeptidase [Streptomyces sp. NK08204]|uniref:D-alanyl-D-alanine carboxypeptidase n=1 Tax=Streptomyces sp. NK08204 TaxID=2873260 RepID=UPI001CED4DDD|nr:D-alanyl-D-alanine carboxypeptidase [Streptomyces sp. NK08204]